MDPLTLAVGAGILAAGVLVGEAHGRIAARRQRPKPPPEAKPICGCRHHRSMHDPAAGECHGNVDLNKGTGLYPSWQQCTCRQYVGPEPITAFWTPPIAAEEGER